MASPCPFCFPPEERIIQRSELAYALWDGYPVSPGHALVIPQRHMGSFFETTEVEREALYALLEQVRSLIDRERAPAGYNIGINDGRAAGQTVPHLHIHLIPRYPGDRLDPRGGVRWIFPDKAKYWHD